MKNNTQCKGQIPRDIEVLILAGGLGTRIRTVLGDTPKLLAPIRNKTFLDFIISWLQGFGVPRLLLCIGHLSEKIIDHVSKLDLQGMSIETSIETECLGTAGAIRGAVKLIRSNEILVLNGDTWVEADLSDFCLDHRRSKAEISILCVEVSDVSRYAYVELDSEDFIERYFEKKPSNKGPGIISAGIYLFSKLGLNRLMDSKGASLEVDFFQNLPKGVVRGYLASSGKFVDIGTPETLRVLDDVLPNY